MIMKKILLTLLLLTAAFFTYGQNITGWNLDVRNTSKMRDNVWMYNQIYAPNIAPAGTKYDGRIIGYGYDKRIDCSLCQ
jgi:hypothetical protein